MSLFSRRPFLAPLLVLLVAAAGSSSSTTLAFSIVDIHHAHHAVQQHLMIPTVTHQQHAAILASQAGGVLQHFPNELWTAYQHQLTVAHPLLTKMWTGGTLAVAGDALAQKNKSKDDNYNNYDVRRAGSFAIFDMAYRALQHYTYPVLVQHCQGTVLASVVAVALSAAGPSSAATEPVVVQHAAAALEQTLASQWIIVPFIYYPIFFTLTGFLQGLEARESWQRAYENIGPLLQRNWCFWIPVQFVQFAWIPTDWQIPFLSCAGLFWTFVLSVAAGSAQTYAATATTTTTTAESAEADYPEQQPYPPLLDSPQLAVMMMRTEQEERMITMATSTLDDSAVIPSSQPEQLVGASAATAYNSVS